MSSFQSLQSTSSDWGKDEKFTDQCFCCRDLQDGNRGWTVMLEDGRDFYECAGHDYVLDLISEIEVPPFFPFCKSYFLVSTDAVRASSPRRVDSDNTLVNIVSLTLKWISLKTKDTQ